MSAQYHSLGKEVLFGDMHIADACSPEVAEQIAAALMAMPRYEALHTAAHAYFHAASNRTGALAAPALRDALNAKPSSVVA